MKVITVTLNPVLERTLSVHYLAPNYLNYTTQPTHLDAAGRGVNVARALHALNAPVEAVILLGKDPSGSAYQTCVEQEGFSKHLIRVSGKTRSSIVLYDTGHQQETQIIEDNAGFDVSEVKQVGDAVDQLIVPGDFVVYAGPLPRDVPDTIYVELLERAQAGGARVVLDIPNQALREAIKANPRVVFLTQNELEGYFNVPVRQREDIIYCAQKLVNEGADRVVILLNEYKGVLLATAESIYVVDFPEIKFGTHSGAVGAMLAGYLAARVKERPVDRALRLGAAAAMFAMEQVGNRFSSVEELKRYTRLVRVEELEKVTR